MSETSTRPRALGRALRLVGTLGLLVMTGCGMDASGFREYAAETIGVEPGYLEVTPSESRIRDDLSYAVASARVDDMRRTRRVVAVRNGDRYLPLKTFADWESALLAGWGQPEPVSACVEAATVTIWLNEQWGAFVQGAGGQLDTLEHLTGPGWERVAEPRLVDAEEPLVELWIVRGEESARFECGFQNESVYLREVEVLRGTGLPAIAL